MTELEALEIVGMITAGYPSWKPTKESLRLYAKLLEPFEEGLTKATVMEILYSPREFAPPIGVLAEAIAVNRMKRAGQYLAPEEAWALVQDQIRRVGFYRNPKFDHPALTRAVEALDWQDICSNDNVEATRAHLMRVFGAMQTSQVREAVGRLVGGELGAIASREEVLQVERASRVEDLVKATASAMGTKKES